MTLPRMSPEQIVFVDVHGVVHARHFDPVTLCDRSIIVMATEQGGKTVQRSPVLCPTIPSVTCVVCIAVMDD